MSVLLCDAEVDALYIVPPEARWLYIELVMRCCRQDSVAGVPAVTVGRKKLITMRSLAKALEFVPPRGSKAPVQTYSKEKMRHMISRLKAAGLLVKTGPDVKQLVFRLPLAEVGS